HAGRGNVCPNRGRRDCLRHWLGLAQPALAPLGGRRPSRDHAIASHALCRVFAPRAFGRVGRFGDDNRWIVRELERAAAHSGRYAAARNLLLGSGRLSTRGTGVPRDWLADSNAARSDGYDLVARPVTRRPADRRSGHRCPVCLDLSGDLFATLAQPRACAPRSVSALAVALLSCVVGVRGVVSLAAALAIPLTTQAGTPFPYRDLILFVTFGVIVVTLVGQGIAVAGRCALAQVGEPRGRRARARAHSRAFCARGSIERGARSA